MQHACQAADLLRAVPKTPATLTQRSLDEAQASALSPNTPLLLSLQRCHLVLMPTTFPWCAPPVHLMQCCLPGCKSTPVDLLCNSRHDITFMRS